MDEYPGRERGQDIQIEKIDVAASPYDMTGVDEQYMVGIEGIEKRDVKPIFDTLSVSSNRYPSNLRGI